MKSKDMIKNELNKNISDALQGGDAGKLTEAFVNFAMELQEDMVRDAEAYKATNDSAILANRGIRVLTSEEVKYYDGLAKAMKASDVRAALTNYNVTLPITIMESVTDNIQKEFPLLNAVKFVTTTAANKIIVSKTGAQLSTWHAFGTAITKELEGSFAAVEVNHCKLTSFIPVSEDMLDEGPQWLDAYIRNILTEAEGLGLTQGIVSGTGKDEPIGMLKDLNGAVTEGVYPDKEANAITKLDTTTYGKIAAQLALDDNGRARTLDHIDLVVNPVDYFKLVLPATTYLSQVGAYVKDVFPYPTTVYQDPNVPTGKGIFASLKDYILAAGVGGKAGRIEYSDEYRFVEDQRVYKTKLLANGRMLNASSVYVADISGLKAL